MNVDSSRLSTVAKMHKRKAHSDCEVFANSKEKLLIFISPKLPALAQTTPSLSLTPFHSFSTQLNESAGKYTIYYILSAI